MDTLQSYLTEQYAEDDRDLSQRYYARVISTGASNGTAYSPTVSECLEKVRRYKSLNSFTRVEIRDSLTGETLHTFTRTYGERFEI